MEGLQQLPAAVACACRKGCALQVLHKHGGPVNGQGKLQGLAPRAGSVVRTERLRARATSVATRMAKGSSRNVASCASLAFLAFSISSLTVTPCRLRGGGAVV